MTLAELLMQAWEESRHKSIAALHRAMPEGVCAASTLRGWLKGYRKPTLKQVLMVIEALLLDDTSDLAIDIACAADRQALNLIEYLKSQGVPRDRWLYELRGLMSLETSP